MEQKFDLKSIKLKYVDPPPMPERPVSKPIVFPPGDIPFKDRIYLPQDKFRLYQLMNSHPNGKRLKELNCTYYTKYPFEIFRTKGPSDELLKLMPLVSRMAYGYLDATHWKLPKSIDEKTLLQMREDEERKKSQIITNLQKMVGEHPNGLLGSELQKNYLEMFCEPLNYTLFRGVESELELAAALPEVFHIVRPNVKNYVLLDARKKCPVRFWPCDIFSHDYDRHPSYPSSGRDPEYSRLKRMRALRRYRPQRAHTQYEALYLADVVGCYDEIPQQIFQLNQEHVEVIVGDIIDPSSFWIQLCHGDKNESFNVLKKKLKSYNGPRHRIQKMPKSAMRANQMCVCPYKREWRRGRILKRPDSENVEVFLIDYGIKVIVKEIVVCFLDKKFGLLPPQAIRCCLANLKPAKDQSEWPPASSERFRRMVTIIKWDELEEKETDFDRKKLQVIFTSFSLQGRSCSCVLVDTTLDEEFHINNSMVLEGHAEYIHNAKPQRGVKC